MADQQRDDMTAHDRDAMTPAGPADKPAEAPDTAAARESDARQPAGTVAPLEPAPGQPQVPEGSIPPGGPALPAGDLLGQRERAHNSGDVPAADKAEAEAVRSGAAEPYPKPAT